MSKKKLKPLQYHLAIQFSERLLQTDLWLSKAEELLSAARLLESEVIARWVEIRMEKGVIVSSSTRPDIQGIYFMLIAYAIENLCKLLLIYRKRDRLKNRLLSKIPNYIKGHDLLRLISDINIKLSVSEQELLARLYRNSIWAARYPVPTNPDDIRAMKKLSNEKSYLTAYFGPRDVDRIKKFLNRLYKHVKKEIDVDV